MTTDNKSALLTTWGPLGANVLLTVGLFILGYWLNGQAQEQAAVVERLAHVEQTQSSTESDVRDITSLATLRSSVRDNQVNGITSRIDKIETSFGNKLDSVANDISSIKADISAIKAVSGARAP